MTKDRTEPPLVPILVDGSGRDGTTLMMQLLGTSAEIAFDRTYPYEQRYLSYLLHWSRLPTRVGWDEESWNRDSLAHSKALEEAGVIGPLPWADRSLITGEGEREFWQDAFDVAWASFSERARAAVRSRLGDQSLSVRYYAQKNADSWTLELARVPVAPRLICVLRDPRDTWVSSVAFHRRRAAEGRAFLPIGPDEPVEATLDRFVADQRTRLHWLRTVEADHEAPVVRYETMVSDLAAVADRLGEWLGLRLDAEAVQLRRGEFADHVTSADVGQSVGRWRQEMSADLAARFWQAMGAELAEFGYEP